MATGDKNTYKRNLRVINVSKKRQALFISEYVMVKHFEIYQQAATLYNKINAIHPKKPDLRKSIEFKNWKLVESGKPRIRPHIPRHPDQHTVHEAIVIQQEEISQEIVASIPKKTFQLRIPLLDPEQIDQTDHRLGIEQVIDEGQQTVDQGQQVDEESHDIDNIQPSSQRQQVDEESHDIDNIQPSCQRQQVDEESHDIDNIQPSDFWDIPEDVVDDIISQLREDPHLSKLMDNVETEFFPQDLDIGMEIELEDRLEEELNQIM